MMNAIKHLISAALMLLGLTGLVDNLVVWVGFFADIQNQYSSIRDTVFGALPFYVPNWVENYVVVGVGVSAGMVAGFTKRAHETLQDSTHIAEAKKFTKYFAILIFLTWPFWLCWYLYLWGSLMIYGEKARDAAQRLGPLTTHVVAAWGWTIVAFLGIVFFFSDLLSRLL